MSDDGSPLQEVVKATAPVAGAVVREAWPYKKVLLAVMPPTLALFSVLVGVWDNGNRDRNARAEAEAMRSAEVKKDQAAADAAQRVRVGDLVLPRYDKLLVDLHQTMAIVRRCENNLNSYLGDVGIGTRIGTNVVLADTSPIPDNEPKTPGDFPVRADVVESCSEIKPSLDPLDLSLDQALLVSNQSLQEAAEGLRTTLSDGMAAADLLFGYVHKVGDEYFIQVIGTTGSWLPNGTSLNLTVNQLNQALTAIAQRSKEIIDGVRGVVLVLDR